MHLCTENGAGQAGSTSWSNTVRSLWGDGFVLAETVSGLMVNFENLLLVLPQGLSFLLSCS